MITLNIDDTEVRTKAGVTVLEAALGANIYIPHLCFRPGLPSSREAKAAKFVYQGTRLMKGAAQNKELAGCGLCVVDIEGIQGLPTACTTPATEGIVVHTRLPEVQELGRHNLALILAKHPHACLTCAEREGCSREPCSQQVPVTSRCCAKLGRCELQRIAEYIGIEKGIHRYIFQDFPVVKNEPFFDMDYNLCIDGCIRCIRICQDVRGIGALGYICRDEKVMVGTVASTLKESGCKFCGACVEICPTGALTDRGIPWVERQEAIVRCHSACPARVDVPKYINFVAQGRFAEALAVIREQAPFPSVLGRICPAPCEDECRHGELNQSVAIRALKRFAAEKDGGLWKQKSKVAPATGKRAAIVGSGPAGLTAAYYLAKLGHGVTVFEALPEPGGMMRVGIPEYRLPRDILRREIQDIQDAGVDIRTNSRIESVDSLMEQGYEVVLLAVGAHQGINMGVNGEDLLGVMDGARFLREVNLG